MASCALEQNHLLVRGYEEMDMGAFVVQQSGLHDEWIVGHHEDLRTVASDVEMKGTRLAYKDDHHEEAGSSMVPLDMDPLASDIDREREMDVPCEDHLVLEAALVAFAAEQIVLHEDAGMPHPMTPCAHYSFQQLLLAVWEGGLQKLEEHQ